MSQIAELFLNSTSADKATRKKCMHPPSSLLTSCAAEETLNALPLNDENTKLLIEFTFDTQTKEEIKQSAAIFIKNKLKRVYDVCSVIVRQFFRAWTQE